MSFDAWSGKPTKQELYDGFDDSDIDTNFWDTTINGDTSITETGGELKFVNAAGDAGISQVISKNNEFGKFQRISADITIEDGHEAGDGEHCEASLVLYKNSDNWIKLGPYRDTSKVLNHAAYLRLYIDGVEYNTGIDITAIGTAKRTFTLMLTEQHIMVYVDGIYRTSFCFPEMIGYYCALEGGTDTNGDTLDIRFNDFEIQHHVDPVFIKLGEMLRSLLDNPVGPTAAQIADAVWDEEQSGHTVVATFGKYLDQAISAITGGGSYTAIGDTASLTSTTPVVIEFLEATYGKVFQILMTLNVTGARCDHCKSYSSSAYTDYDDEANNLVLSDVPLVAAAGAAVNNIIWFGLSEHSHRLRCVVSPGPLNSDNVFSWVYWDGSAAQALAGVSDGTKVGSYAFSQDGDVTWTTEVAEKTLDSQAAFWVGAKITTLGASRPKGSYFTFSPATAVDFDSLSVFGKRLYVSIFRKVGASYGLRPDDIMAFQQSNLRKNITIDVTGFSDTKVVLQLESTPIGAISVPWEGTVATLSE